MLNKYLHSKQSSNESGFTLVELLVVIVIIGLLAAIAVPIFMNQRNEAHDAAVISDLHNFNIIAADHLVEHGRYPARLNDMRNLSHMQWSWGSIQTNQTNMLFCTPRTPEGAYKGEEWLLMVRSMSGKGFITGTPIASGVEAIDEDVTSQSQMCLPEWGEGNYNALWGLDTSSPDNTARWANPAYFEWNESQN